MRAALLAVLLMAGCADRGLQPFTSDGCSLFPDKAPIGDADWCGCCLAHDRAYWRGGTEEQRRAADDELETCVRKATGGEALAKAMRAGVRVGGTPVLPTPFRWGYGWPYDRGYQPLTPEEEVVAQRQFRPGAAGSTCERSKP